jgi:hypothetical protein
MKLAIPLLATAAAMGLAVIAMPSSASAACVTGAAHFNFVELHCDHKMPAWWTPVRYKDIGGNGPRTGSAPVDDCPPCPPPCYDKVILTGFGGPRPT